LVKSIVNKIKYLRRHLPAPQNPHPRHAAVINPAPAAAERKAYGRFEIAAQINCRRGETPVNPASTFTV
jgi:hypothetical protein